MTSILYDEAFKALDLKGNEKLVDAYSGVGTIGLSVAKQVREVRGMDTIADAVQDANANSVRNGIFNCLYEVGEAEELLPEWVNDGWTRLH